MTPQAAKQNGRRWYWATAVFGFAAALVSFIGFEMFAVPLVIAAQVCCVQGAEWSGWRDGYLACKREAKAGVGGRRG